MKKEVKNVKNNSNKKENVKKQNKKTTTQGTKKVVKTENKKMETTKQIAKVETKKVENKKPVAKKVETQEKKPAKKAIKQPAKVVENGKIRVGINGFGRIGRMLLRIISERDDMEVVAINNPRLTLEYAEYLYTHDTIYGGIRGTCTIKGKALIVNGKRIAIFGEDEPKLVPWDKANVQLVVDASGAFKSSKDLGGHLKSGVEKVIITAPADGDIPTYIYGVNTKKYKGEKIVSASSCTTNCLAPLVKVIDEAFGIEEAVMSTIHSATASQKVVDGSSRKDYRGGRATAYNIIPASTGATKSLVEVLPKFKNKFTGLSFRVPTLDVSVIDLTCKLVKKANMEKIIKTLLKAEMGAYAGVIKITDDAIVSSDIIGEPCTCVFDITASQIISPNFVKLVAWYDNEYGYSTQVVNLITEIMSKKKK